jgi:hypothetical protein
MRISHWPKVDTRWYLGVHCRRCETPILFALDHSNGETQPSPAEKLFLTCSSADCKHQGDYSAATVLRFQKTGPSATESKRRRGDVTTDQELVSANQD